MTSEESKSGKERWDRRLGRYVLLKAHQDNAWPFVAFTLLILAGIIVLWADPDCYTDSKEDGFSRTTTVLLLLWVAWIYAWVIHCFSGDPYANRTRTIRFAYFFVTLSFVAVSIMVANIGRASSFGVVEGCVTSADDTSFLPIRCDHPVGLPRPQAPLSDAQVQARIRAAVSDAAKEAATKEAVAKAAGAAAKGEAKQGKTDTGGAGGSNAGAGTATGGAGVAGSTPALSDSGEASKFQERMKNAAINHNYHHLLNIGGRLDRIEPLEGEFLTSGCPAKMIHGGVPVPVYFILLALIGAAISLARNVPVIQRRSEESYVSTSAEPRLAPAEVRELLAFQILQFVSAPFLAVAAYHTLKPESLATTVALGFLTGFASEKILSLLSVRLRDLKDGEQTAKVLIGQIYGRVTLGGKNIAGATVEIEGLAKLKPVQTDANGCFKFTGVPVSPQPYRLHALFKDKDAGAVGGSLDVRLDVPKELDAGAIGMEKPS